MQYVTEIDFGKFSPRSQKNSVLNRNKSSPPKVGKSLRTPTFQVSFGFSAKVFLKYCPKIHILGPETRGRTQSRRLFFPPS